MKRRELLKAGIGATVLGAGGPAARAPSVGLSAAERPAGSPPAVLSSYTAADHRRRLNNVAVCESGIRKCMRKHLITDYLPGQCVYNLGEYPCQKPWETGDYDERQLDELRDHGIGLIHLHEEWNDALRLFGGHKFAPLNPAGFRRFVDGVHARGMKVIVYFSTGFLDRRDPDFRRAWARRHDLVQCYWQYARCSPASPGWRAYLLGHLMRILDEYGVDGIYNDLGYVPLADQRYPRAGDEVLAFEERADRDGALEDLLALVYADVKRRGGIVKLHLGDVSRPQTIVKVYDYLWVGESMANVDALREKVKNHPPYVVPCIDMNWAKTETEDELYLHAIPYMQFPVLMAGRPFTGERAAIPGIEYAGDDCPWVQHLRAIWRHHQAHPDGPYSYGWWDAIEGRPDARPTHARWLKRYLPMVEEGTRAYLEISDSTLFTRPLPENVVASAFANRDLYLVLANYDDTSSAEISTRDPYVAVAENSAQPKTVWRLLSRTVIILRRSVA